MKIFLSFILSLLACAIYAQEIPISITDQIEAFLEEQDEDVDVLELMDRLSNYYDQPININKVSYEDLKDLRLLSEVQINDIIDHIALYGELIGMEELQSIPSLNMEDIRRIRPFFKVNDPDKVNISILGMLAESRNILFLKWTRFLEEKKGYKLRDDGTPRYLGDANRFFVRYKNSYENKFRLGFTLEKDPGEEFMKSADNAGFDYFTLHAYLRDYTTLLKDLAIGDYTISFGQGLISHNSFGAGKSAYVSNIKRGGRVVKPFNSVFENGYMRGVATTLRLHENVELTAFGSLANRDGNPTDTLDLGEDPLILFSSLQTSGNHRTESEIADKRTLGITSWGASLKFKKRNYHLAVNTVSHNFDKELQRDNQLSNLYRFEGNGIQNLSVDYAYRWRNFNFFGESAYSSTGGTAHLAAVLIGLDKYASMSLLYRNYAKDYNALEPNAFGESSTVQNENGIYIGFEYQLSPHWRMSTYADFWKHPWLRSRISKPSSGQEYLAKLDYNIRRKMNVYLQYTYEQKDQDFKTDEFIISPTGIQTRHRLRLHFSNKIYKALELRTRLEYSRFQNPVESQDGYLFYQDFIYRSSNSPLSITARIALFDTDDFESRIYAYENALLYEFAIPSYFDQGFRYYFNIRHRLTNKITAEMRFARTHFTRLELRNDPSSIYYHDTVGSNGNEQIIGDTRSEVRLQMRYAF